MKRALIVFASCLVLFALASSSQAVYFHEGPISNDFVLSEPLRQSQVDLSAQVEYVDFAEVYAGNTDLQWQPLKQVMNRVTMTVVPLKAAYGITDDMSIRLTVPFVSFYYEAKSPPLRQGYGVGDIRLEGVYGIIKETDSNPSAAINLCVKAQSVTDFNHRGLNEMPTGNGSTDWIITGIFGKKLGPIEGTAILGYDFQGSYLVGNRTRISGTTLMCSLAGVYPSGNVDYGAEIWGNFAPAAKEILSADEGMMNQTEWTDINISPFIRCRASEDVTFKAVIDVPLGTKATFDDSSDIAMRVLRGVNVTLGGSWSI